MSTKLFKQGINFKCIGNKCTDSCCIGWDITFDKQTYENLSQNPDTKETMKEYAYINEDASIEAINYGIVNLTDDCRCPFLAKDDLCSLQKKNGEDSLSNVCALYPRYYNKIDGIYEESLSLACIEAAENLLLSDPLVLIELDRGPKRDVILQNIESQTTNGVHTDIRYLHDFRRIVFKLLRNNTYTFDDKLGMLMTFHQSIEGIDEKTLKSTLESYDFTAKKKGIGIDKSTYEKLILLLKKVEKSEHVELDNLIYDCINNPNYDQLNLERHANFDRIMSNYLIHQMFKDLYPFIAPYNKMDSFQYLLKKVQMLRLLIVYDGQLNDKRVAQIIQMYSKGLEHHGAFHYELEELIL